MNISRKDFLKYTALTAAGLATGCATRLPTNVAQNFKEGDICLNEDVIRMQKVGLLGEHYFAIPLNTKERILNGGEPSFALIPEAKARISVKQVGKKGGEVIVDAPEGHLYLPYVYVTDGKNKHELSTNFLDTKPVRFITSSKMGDLKKPNSKDGKISLDGLITEEDLPFSDETLKTIGEQEYLINRIGDERYTGKDGDIDKGKILPFYATERPVTVEYNRAAGDRKIRIRGNTYLFARAPLNLPFLIIRTKEGYFSARGFEDIESEKTAPKETSIETDTDQ